MKKRLKAFSRTTIALLTAALVCSPFTKAYADDTVDSLEKQTNGLQNQLDSLNQDLTSLSAEITDLASKIEDTDASVQKATLAMGAARYPIPAIYLHLVAVMDYMSLKQPDRARAHLLKAWEIS